MIRIRPALSVALAIVAMVASTSVALGANPPTGYTGRWTTIDCAQWWEDGHMDCDVWGDGSAMFLTIGRGESPRVVFHDVYASSCDGNGAPSSRWVAAGTGVYDDVFLWLVFDKSGCGTFGRGGYAVQEYYDPGSDTIWEDWDGDGWGNIWRRA
jgi:hypothetical protein